MSIGEQKKSFREADQFNVEFWKLYWADLAFVEQQGVESAMVLFGKKLKEIDSKLLESVPASIKTSPLYQKENRDQLTARQFAQNLVIESTDDLKPQLEVLKKQALSADDIRDLKKLAKKLIDALQQEQRQRPELKELKGY